VTDRIEVRGLELLLLCGVLPEERTRRQPFELDLDLHLDLSAPAVSDELSDTVDYGRVCMDLVEALEAEQFSLMERLAGRVVELVLAHPGVDAVTVAVRKLRPPVPASVATTGVRLHRSR
jgi:7,8-dihydroneopterin aldolase/epimerase/oxygenase